MEERKNRHGGGKEEITQEKRESEILEEPERDKEEERVLDKIADLIIRRIDEGEEVFESEYGEEGIPQTAKRDRLDRQRGKAIFISEEGKGNYIINETFTPRRGWKATIGFDVLVPDERDREILIKGLERRKKKEAEETQRTKGKGQKE